MNVMDDKLKKKLIDACSSQMYSIDCQNLSLDGNKYLEIVLENVVEQCIRTYQEETGYLPFESDVVYVSFPIDEMKNVKRLVLSACAPQVTFNDDFEVMKDERDKSRQGSLADLQAWINRALR